MALTNIEQQIVDKANSLGIPPTLAISVAKQESGINQLARGSSGEVGIFQLMPGTASDLGVNPYDIDENITGGLTYLKQQYDRFGSWDKALAAYNAGPGRVVSNSIPNMTLSYVENILRNAGLLDSGGNWGMSNYLSAGSIDSQINNGMPLFTSNVFAEPITFPLWPLAVGSGALIYLLLIARPRRQ